VSKYYRVGFKEGLSVKQIDPLAARLTEVGHTGGASKKLTNLTFKKFKKTINKTPNKIIPKTQKKKIIQQQKTIKNKFEAKGDKWMSPIKLRKGGKV
jgi:hypothetical protein